MIKFRNRNLYCMIAMAVSLTACEPTAADLLAEANKSIENGDFNAAKAKLHQITYTKKASYEAAEAGRLINMITEREAWNLAQGSEEPYFTQSYLDQYPYGTFSGAARARLDNLLAIKKQRAFDEAVRVNSSTAWQKYLNDYPNHPDAENIRRKIIQLEVDEILGDRDTKELPALQREGDGYAENSSVTIKNNTGCALVVRYSGETIFAVTLVAGEERQITLPTGSYRVAASACGANCAGTETLSGRYSSTYYIQTRTSQYSSRYYRY